MQDEEAKKLLEGVALYGYGQWAQICAWGFDVYRRTNVDLKVREIRQLRDSVMTCNDSVLFFFFSSFSFPSSPCLCRD